MLALAACCGTTSADAARAYATGFEPSEGFSPGQLSPDINSAQGGWSGGIQGGFTNNDVGDEAIIAAPVHSGTQAWHYARGYGSPGQGTPYGPVVEDGDGNGASNNGDRFVASLWFKAASETPDEQRVGITTGTADGGDRGNYLASIKNTTGGVQIYSYDDGANFRPVNLFIGVSTTEWHKLDFTLTKNGAVDQVSVSLDGGAPVVYNAALNEWRQSLGYGYSDHSRLKFSAATDGDLAQQGFYFDDVSYEVVPNYPVKNITSNTGYMTIQGAIDAAAAGDMIHVYPGSYSETATDRGTTTDTGPHQFGLFFPPSKPGLTIQGVKADGSPVTTAADVAATVTTNATNTFGYAGIFVAAANTTVRGIDIGNNSPANDKTIEVIADSFTFAASKMSTGSPLYIGDYAYDDNSTPADFSDDHGSIQSYTITGNEFSAGSGIYIANGAGWNGATPSAVAGRAITGNLIHDSGTLAFGGPTPGFGWLNYPVGAATVTGNTWDGPNTRYVQAWGTTQAVFPFGSYYANNTYPKSVITTTDGNPDHVRGYDIAPNYYNLLRIGTVIQARIDNSQAGDTVLVGPGTYAEQVLLNKTVTVAGANSAVSAGSHPGTRSAESVLSGGFYVTAAGARIDGMQIQSGFTSGSFKVGVAVAASGVTVEDSIIENVLSPAQSDGLSTQPGNNNLTVTNCTIRNNWRGIYLNPGSGHTLTGNLIDANNGVGVGIGSDGQSNLTLTGNVISNNTLEGWGASAVGSGVVAQQNNFINNGIAVAHYGGSAIDASRCYWGNEDGPTGATNGVSGSVGFSPWYADAARTILRDGIVEDLVITTPQTFDDLYIAPGTTVTVTPEGSLAADKVELADGAEITVNGGELDLGQDSVISGTFTIFNSFGSWDINGDTTFNIGQSLALISDIHVAAGKTVTVNGGGELILDGCIMDSQTPGTPYNFTAATDGLLTLARCVVTDANIDINTTLAGNLKSRVYDSSFITSDIEAAPAAKVYHNLLDAATDAAKNSDATAAFAAIDGWANVTDADDLQNKFTLDFEAPAAIGRTLDAAGNLFVQPADAVVVKMDVAALGTNTITAAEALLGYNSGMLTLAGTPTRVTPLGAWEVIAETAPAPSGLGIVDSALGLQLNAGLEGISADSQIARVNFTAGSPGLTLGFFRVQTNGQFNPDGTLVKDTRLTKSTAGMPSLLEAFTANTGELVIDNQLPAIATTGQTGTQVQPTNGTVDVLNPANYVIRDGTPVMLSFTATDAGLAGLDAPDATADLALTAYNGTTTLGTADYTVTAVEAAGVVTYTVTLNVPSTATTGTYAVTATVRDRSGNVSPLATLGSFQIANEVLATVELEAYAGGTRQVVFTATNSSGTVLTSWTKNVVFTGTTGTVPLEAVPSGTAAISAKTAWNLRSKVAATFTPEGVEIGGVSLTGTDKLPGGDITGDNVVNTLDYSVLRYHWLTNDAVANINGDTIVNLADYGLLKGNFYTIGDPQ